MQEKDKKPRRIWRGFEGEDGITEYGIHLRGERVSIVANQEGAEDEEQGRVEMSVADFKQFLAMAQEMLHGNGGEVMRDTGITRK